MERHAGGKSDALRSGVFQLICPTPSYCDLSLCLSTYTLKVQVSDFLHFFSDLELVRTPVFRTLHYFCLFPLILAMASPEITNSYLLDTLTR